MSSNSKIEWTDATSIRARNLKTGKVGWHCEHATTGCEHCYSEGFNMRLGTGLPFKPGHRKDIEIFLDEEMLTLPLRWKKPRMIFVCSMTDLFAEFVPDEWINKLFAVMALCPQHTFQVLTKRAARMRRYCSDEATPYRIARACLDLSIADKAKWTCEPWPVRSIGDDIDNPDDVTMTNWPLRNVWKGVSCERQQEADERIPHLLATPAAIHFVSAEPLLGPLDLRQYTNGVRTAYLDWVIAGGESGRNARPMHPDWVRSLRDQCEAPGVEFFFKQWGEWAPDGSPIPIAAGARDCPPGTLEDNRDGKIFYAGHGRTVTTLRRVGKKAAGRLLDGIEHNSMPGATA